MSGGRSIKAKCKYGCIHRWADSPRGLIFTANHLSVAPFVHLYDLLFGCLCLCFNSVRLILLYIFAGTMADEVQNDVNDQVADVSFSVSYLLSPSTYIFIQYFYILWGFHFVFFLTIIHLRKSKSLSCEFVIWRTTHLCVWTPRGKFISVMYSWRCIL